MCTVSTSEMMMIILVYVNFIWFLQVKGHSSDQSCEYSISKYKYEFLANFRYIPRNVLNQTRINLTTEIYYHQSKSPCNRTFIRLENLSIQPNENESFVGMKDQFEKAIRQIFIQTDKLLQNSSDENIISTDYQKNSIFYRQIRTHSGQLHGHSLLHDFLLNKLIPPTKTTCEITINLANQRLDTHICNSTTAGLLTIHRQMIFVNQISNSSKQTSEINSLKQRTKKDFDHLLKENTFDYRTELIDILTNELTDEELTEILHQSNYSISHWKFINEILVQVPRLQSTEYLLRNFFSDQILLNHHFDLLDNPSKSIFQNYFTNSSCQIPNLITFRMLRFFSDDHLTIQCIFNRTNPWIYRSMAIEILQEPKKFSDQLRKLIQNENEDLPIRILSFEKLSSELHPSEIDHFIQTSQSKQFRYYLQSLSQQTSLWSAQSGSYQFPFGKVNVIFPDDASSIIPNLLQLRLANKCDLDLFRRSDDDKNGEILIMINRQSFVQLSTIEQVFQWFKHEHIFEIPTLDGFRLRMKFQTNFQRFENLFQKSSAGIQLKVEHSLGNFMTGYEIFLNINSNFRIKVDEKSHATSYLWYSNQQENILLQIKQVLKPLVNHRILPSTNSSSSKDLCYIIPHFDSKICLSFIFERLWPSSISIRLLSDDPSLIYNFTSTKTSLHFHLQQNDQIFRSYELLQKSSSFELSTPTTNYTLAIHWNTSKEFLFDLLKNHRIITHGLGLFRMNSMNNLSIHLTKISPKHIGEIFIDYDGNLTINAPKFLGGKFLIEVNRINQWKAAQMKIFAERNFFFFKQTYEISLDYNLLEKALNLAVIRNNHSSIQWISRSNETYFYQKFLLNSSLIEFSEYIEGYFWNSANMKIDSKCLINGWTVWNISGLIDSWKRMKIQLNRFLMKSEINNQTMNFQIEYFNQNLIKLYSVAPLIIRLDIPGYHYETHGKVSANYTNLSLDFPISENSKNNSHVHFDLFTFSNNLIFNLTSTVHQQYFLRSSQNLTFAHHYLSQITHQLTLQMHEYHLISFDFLANYLSNSTNLQSLNGSLQLPSLFFSKPFRFSYEKDSHLFIQLFEYANFTQSERDSHLKTPFGLELLIKNNLPATISFHFKQKILNKYLRFLIEIDRNWMVSLILTEKVRYEFVTSPLDSSLFIRKIDFESNQTHLLPINYYTDNQTLIRIEILFSKYFTRFLNDFIFDISLKNHSLKFFSHIPLFRREFVSLTWNRLIQKELFHFAGFVQMKFLGKRRLLDYEYDYNLASIRFWTLNSNLSLFSLNPIRWNFNLTNDYLWNGKWNIDFSLILGQYHELVRLNHQYSYTVSISNIIFDLKLINRKYFLDFNYSHLNQTIHGLFRKNFEEHQIQGDWNQLEHALSLNTTDMKSKTIITPIFLKSIIQKSHQKIGILFQRSTATTTDLLQNETEILECNPYLIIRSSPRLFTIDYYTLNDGLTKLMFEWSTRSYLSWNYTSQGQINLPIRKFEIDLREKYIFRYHTLTFKYSSIYNPKRRQLTVRREPTDEHAEDTYQLKTRLHSNQTLAIHLRIIHNHFRIFAYPNEEKSFWLLNGTFRHDRFHGSLNISKNDWLLSAKFDFNSTFSISTGQFVQYRPTNDSQFALEIFLKSQFHLVLQYSSLRSLMGLKLAHHSSDIDLECFSKSINQTFYQINFRLNQLINQTWILQISNQRFYLYDQNLEFIFNGSFDDFLFLHSIANKTTRFFFDENTLIYSTNTYGLILSNLSSDTTKYLHLYHQPSKQNLTLNYYKYGKFQRKNFNIQTPIYDLNLIYFSDIEQDRYVKFIFELLPLQMSSFNLVRGRTFRIGYQTKQKQCLLEGNLALGVEDIDNTDRLTMNERWKLFYGLDKRDRILIKWNLIMNVKTSSIQGSVHIHDPNDQNSKSITIEIDTQMNDPIFRTNIRSKSIHLQIDVDQHFLTQQNISWKLTDELSRTNLSFAFVHYPKRELILRLKPNDFSAEQTYFHFYANTTESQLKFLVLLHEYLHLNLTLPKSYPESGILQSSLAVDGNEYFHGSLDRNLLELRFREYLLNVSLNQLVLRKRDEQTVLASIRTQWTIDRNSSKGLLTIFSQTDFPTFSIPIEQSIQQKTWFARLEEFLFENNLTQQFTDDFGRFLSYLKSEHGQIADHFKLDEDATLTFERMNSTAMNIIEKMFEVNYFIENFFEEYLNNLSCLSHHQNIFHLNASQLTTLTVNTFVSETISYVNQSLTMLNHFTRYPHSISAILTYLSNGLIVNLYKFSNKFVLETKAYFLSTSLRYLHEFDILFQISPILFESITYLSSNDIQIIIQLISKHVRKWLTVWKDSPVEYKLLRTISSLPIEILDRLRFYLDDKLDFLIPTLKIFHPKLVSNQTVNQTFLLTWSKQSD